MANIRRLKRFGFLKRLYKYAHYVYYHLRWYIYRKTTPQKLNRHIAICETQGKPIKLQVGASNKLLPGWLNTDFEPNRNTIFLDISRPLPFSDGQVDFVVAEHVIEHVPKTSAALFLRECFRCLKPGGRLRISTPNLTILCHLLICDDYHEMRKKLVERHARLYRASDDITVCDFFNDVNRMWGHKYLYTPEELEDSITRSGFTKVEQSSYGTSLTPTLVGVDQHQEGEPMGPMNLIFDAIR